MKRMTAIILVLCGLLGVTNGIADTTIGNDTLTLTGYKRDAQGMLVMSDVVKALFFDNQLETISELLTLIVDFSLLCQEAGHCNAVSSTKRVEYILDSQNIVMKEFMNNPQKFERIKYMEGKELEAGMLILNTLLDKTLSVVEDATWDSPESSVKFLKSITNLVDICCIKE